MNTPDELLAELRLEVELVRKEATEPSNATTREESRLRILSIAQDIDAVLSRGGELPKAWAPPGLVRVHEEDLAHLLRVKKAAQQAPVPREAAAVHVTCLACGLVAAAAELRRGNAARVLCLPRAWGTLSYAGEELGHVCSIECGIRQTS